MTFKGKRMLFKGARTNGWIVPPVEQERRILYGRLPQGQLIFRFTTQDAAHSGRSEPIHQCPRNATHALTPVFVVQQLTDRVSQAILGYIPEISHIDCDTFLSKTRCDSGLVLVQPHNQDRHTHKTEFPTSASPGAYCNIRPGHQRWDVSGVVNQLNVTRA